MQPTARLIQNPSTNPEGFDYRNPLQQHFDCCGLREGAALMTDPIPAPPQGADLVVSFQATDAAVLSIEFFTDSAEGGYWTPVALPVHDQLYGAVQVQEFAEAVAVPAAEQRVYRLQMPESAARLRASVRAVRACKRVDVFTQVRKAVA